MNCDRYEDLIHLHVDHRLNKKETESLMAHMETCSHCKETYDEISALKELLGGIQMKELPDGFEQELHFKLVKAQQEKSETWRDRIKAFIAQGSKMKLAASFGGIALAAVLVVAGTGLLPNMDSAYPEQIYEMASEAYDDSGATEEMFTMATMDAPTEEAMPALKSMDALGRAGDVVLTFSENSELAVTAGQATNFSVTANGVTKPTQTSDNTFSGRLIIKTANLSLDVENYDEVSTEVYRMVEELGGYISDTSSYFYIYDRYDDGNNKKSGYMTLRIPHQAFDQFVKQLNTFGVVTNFSSNANDITKQYRDTTSEVKNLEVREAKLRDIMDKAEEIKDIIEVERELSRVRSDINRYQSILTDWEDLVSLSTITINMTEVEDLKIFVKPVDKDVLTKAKEGFIYTINRLVDALEGLFVWLIASSPVVLPVGIIGGFTLRKLYKRWKN